MQERSRLIGLISPRGRPASISGTKKAPPRGSAFEVFTAIVALGAELVAREAADLDVLAQLADLLREDLFDHLLGVLDERLVEEAHLRVVFLELAFDDLLDRGGGLAFHLGGGDVALLGDLGLGDLLAADIGRAGGGDLEADVLAERLEVVGLGDEVRLAVDLDEHADLAADVDVGMHQAFLRRARGELVDLVAELLAEDRDRLLRVALGLIEGLLDVEQTSPGLFPELADHGSGNGSHVIKSDFVGGDGGLLGGGAADRALLGDGLLLDDVLEAGRDDHLVEVDLAGGGGGLVLGRGGAARLAVAEAGGDGTDDGLDDDADRLRGVVVARDRVSELGRVGIRVDQADARDADALGLGHRDRLVAGVDHEHGARERGDGGDAVKIAGHAGHLATDRRLFLGGQLGELAAGVHGLVLFELRERLLDRLEIGERAAHPAGGHVGHAGGRGGLADQLLGLALGADEEDVIAVGDEILDEGAGLFEGRVRLLEVNDADALTVVEDVGLGARIPTLGLVTEVDAGIEEVFGSYVHGIYVVLRDTGRPTGPPCDRYC